MKWFSVCSGIGGFDLALRNLGHEIVGACEIAEHPRQVYEKHFPGVPVHHDVTKIDETRLPDFDGFVAGFPCQTFSIMGKRLGFQDARGEIFFDLARIIKEKRPKYLLLENVKGLLSHDKQRTIKVIFDTLEGLGYNLEWQVLNSKYFLPQNRERIFIIGHLRGRSGRKVFPLGDYDQEVNPKNLRQIGNVDTKGHNSIWGRVYHPEGIAATLNAHGGGLGAKTGLYAVTRDHDTLRPTDQSLAIDANYWKGPDNHGQRTMILLANKNSNMKNRIQNRDETWCLGANGNDFGIFEGDRVRRLTPKECERLQGFPDDWTKLEIPQTSEAKKALGIKKYISDTKRYEMCGNAVTVPTVQYILEKLHET